MVHRFNQIVHSTLKLKIQLSSLVLSFYVPSLSLPASPTKFKANRRFKVYF